MANTKLSAFFSLLLVFCSGIVVGGVGYHVYATTKTPPPVRAQDPPEVRRRQLIEEDTKEMKLTPDQVSQLEKVYDHTLERFNEIWQKQNAESRATRDDQIAQIKSFLNPEQIALYDKLRAKRQAQREENDRKKSGGRRKGGPDQK